MRFLNWSIGTPTRSDRFQKIFQVMHLDRLFPRYLFENR